MNHNLIDNVVDQLEYNKDKFFNISIEDLKNVLDDNLFKSVKKE